jgi:hypothetical protein
MTVKHVTVTRKVKEVGKNFVWKRLSSQDIFDNQQTGAINCCGPVRQNLKWMLQGLYKWRMTLKSNRVT